MRAFIKPLFMLPVFYLIAYYPRHLIRQNEMKYSNVRRKSLSRPGSNTNPYYNCGKILGSNRIYLTQ